MGTENRDQKKSSNTVRLTPYVLRAIHVIRGNAQVAGLPQPVSGDLIDAAWRRAEDNECPRCHWKPGDPLTETPKSNQGLSGTGMRDGIAVTGEEAKVVAVWRLMPEGWQRRVMGIMEEAAASDPLTPEGKDAAPPKRGSRRQGNQ